MTELDVLMQSLMDVEVSLPRTPNQRDFVVRINRREEMTLPTYSVTLTYRPIAANRATTFIFPHDSVSDMTRAVWLQVTYWLQETARQMVQPAPLPRPPATQPPVTRRSNIVVQCFGTTPPTLPVNVETLPTPLMDAALYREPATDGTGALCIRASVRDSTGRELRTVTTRHVDGRSYVCSLADTLRNLADVVEQGHPDLSRRFRSLEPVMTQTGLRGIAPTGNFEGTTRPAPATVPPPEPEPPNALWRWINGTVMTRYGHDAATPPLRPMVDDNDMRDLRQRLLEDQLRRYEETTGNAAGGL